ncbi:hypothetical protein GGR57DRAFT_476405 [Xylariaceae sp. FL1272]|nr:hypothetical protein GGR57DRAFT_476405 [Xylariaceae sp. FL1272]
MEGQNPGPLTTIGCANRGKELSVTTRFIPCLCEECTERERTLFVSICAAPINIDTLFVGDNPHIALLGTLHTYFSSFGKVEEIVTADRDATLPKRAIHVK